MLRPIMPISDVEQIIVHPYYDTCEGWQLDNTPWFIDLIYYASEKQ